MFLFFSFCLLAHTKPTIFYDVMLQTLIFCFFKCFMLFKSIAPSHSFRIILIKINDIKVNIIKIYANNIPIIIKESNNILVYKIKDYMSLLEDNVLVHIFFLLTTFWWIPFFWQHFGSYCFTNNILVHTFLQTAFW